MTYIAKETIPRLGMVIEQAYIPVDEKSAELLCNNHFLIKYDETTEPRPGKRVHLYEEKSYLSDLLIVREGILYTSTCETATTFIYNIDPQQSEWLKV